MAPTYNELVGARLRSIRRQRGLSLQDVQRISSGEFKAAVVGAYERGERSLSLPRLHRLAAFFQVPITQFLPQEETGESAVAPLPSGGVSIDLNRVEALDGSEADIFRSLTMGGRLAGAEERPALTIIYTEPATGRLGPWPQTGGSSHAH